MNQWVYAEEFGTLTIENRRIAALTKVLVFLAVAYAAQTQNVAVVPRALADDRCLRLKIHANQHQEIENPQKVSIYRANAFIFLPSWL